MTQRLKLKLQNIFSEGKKKLSSVSAWRKNLKLKNIFKAFRSRRFGAVVVLIIFLVANFFQSALETQGAQYTFAQTDWSGGVTANDAAHPANESGWTQYSAGTNVVTNVAGQATIAETNHESFSETFTGTTYKDAANTTANWNTSGGQVEMAGESNGVNLYEKLQGPLAGAYIYSIAKFNDDIYVAGSLGKFLKYNKVNETVVDLSSKISSYITAAHTVYSLAVDSANGVVYLGATNVLVRYNTSSYPGGGAYPTADTAYDLTAKVSFVAANYVYALKFDSVNNALYVAGTNGTFGRYNTTTYTGAGTYPDADTGYDLTAKISGAPVSWGAAAINAMEFDSANKVIYIAGASGKFGRYNITTYTGAGTYPDADTAYDLTAKTSATFSGTRAVQSITLDSVNNVLYLSGQLAKFARYNTTTYTGAGTYPDADTGYDLTAKISINGHRIYASNFDLTNGVLYLVGEYGHLVRYNATTYAGGGTYSAADTAYDLTAKTPGNYLYASLFDSSSNIFFAGGDTASFIRYNTTSYGGGGTYPTADTVYNLIYKVNGVNWNGSQVSAIVSGNNNEIYLGGPAGKFAKYNTSTGIATDLTSKISGAPISWAGNISALAFDSANNVVYIGGGSGKFARYNTTSYPGGGTYPAADTAYNLTAKISGAPVSWSTNEIFSLSLNASGGFVYLGGAGGKFARYNVTTYAGAGTYPTADTAYDLTAKISGAPVSWSTNIIYSLAFDSANKVVYLSGAGGKFARYNASNYTGAGTYSDADTAYDLTAKISGAPVSWSTNIIRAIIFDSANNALYLGGQAGKFARYNTTTYTGAGTYPDADTAYDLTAKLSSFWSGLYIYGLALDSSSGAIYIGGQSGKFGKYMPQSDTGVNLRSPDLISFWGTSNSIFALSLGGNGNLYFGGLGGYFVDKPGIPSTVYAVSSTLDAVSWNIAYATLTKNDTVGTGTIAYQLSNDGGSTWETVTPSVNHVFSSVGSDLRFKIAVSGNATVQDVSIAYWAYNPTGELTSSKYNATDSTNVLAKMAWTETLPAGTDIKFQLRTSADGSSWTAWCGPDDGVPGSCSSATYFTNPAGTETVDDINNDQTNDQWFQYKAYLSTSDGVNTPTLSDATATYVVNAPPEIQNISASQGADGLVTVNYELRDPDTTTGVTQNTVAITLQYCTANCSNAGSETWTDAATVTNDGAGVSVQEVNWTAHQMVWTADTDYTGQYNATDFKIRIKAYDGELANHTTYASSSVFTLDTSDPTLASDTLLINDSTSAVTPEVPALTLKLQNITGDSATETVYAQFSTDGVDWYGANGNSTLAAAGSWGTGFALNDIATLSWPWTMAARSETITVRIKDGYGNLQATTDTNSSQYNAYPELQTITASQGADGSVTVDYEAKDTDTLLGVTPNAVNITLQYCTANCSSPGNETWAAALTATGDGAGVSVSGTGWTAHQVVWTAATDYAEQYNATDFKVRIKADDGDPVNNLDYLESASFILDTTDPVVPAFVIDHSANQLSISAPTDEGNFEVYVGNSSSTLFDAGNKTSPILNQASSYPNTYTYASMTNDPATVYVGAKDAKGNTAYVQATTPARPTNPIYFDISSTNQGTYQEFLAWDVVSIAQVGSGFSSYKVYRKINDGSFSLLATINDRTLNYYLDRIKDTNDATTDSDPTFDPNSPSTYYYKIVTTDTGGNISAFSGEITDAPNGAGGSDSTPPTITNVQVSNINTTSAVVTWQTDELANSSVGYSTNYTYIPERGLSSFEMLTHEITLTGLLPNTTYHINVQSEDVYGNNGLVCFGGDGCSPGSNNPDIFTFTTDPGPAISSVAVSSTNTQAAVSWVTTTNSDTYVVYSDTVTNGALVAPEEVGTPTLVGGDPLYNHSQTLTTFNDLPLVSGETYYFYVKSTDATAQTAIDDNGGNFYSFTTTQDDDAPVMSGINAAIINNTKAAINWTTDEAATGTVNYGTVSGAYTVTSEVLTYDKSHYVILNPLLANTTYYYTVTSADINTNSATSTEYSFTTLNDPAFIHDPLSAISGISDPPTVLTDTKAVISFTTDQAAECVIEYGTAAGNYTEVPVAESGFNETHSMHITGLIFETAYYYQITCADNLENTASSIEYSFTTSERLYTESGIGSLTDLVAPAISGVSTDIVSGESVTVTWTTDEAASSYVRYGIATGTYTDMAGDPLVNFDKTLYDTAHTVIVNGLTPGTEYFFTVISHDATGNIGESSETSFTTGASSSLSSINISSAALGEALITWTTSEKTSSVVEYGLTNLYGQKKEDTTAATAHSITINGLAAAQLYHIRVSGEDELGQLYSSGDYTFTPKSPPKIAAVTVKDITEHEATVSFSTDFPTDYTITYTSASGDSGSKGKPDFAINHEITLDKLKPGTTYTMKIKASDEQGNGVEQVAQTFTTGKDENAPEITKARTESALAQSDKVQTIISWETNELSTCSLIYREGTAGDEKEYKVNDRAALNHVAVVTTFKPGTVYYFKIKSLDEADNESVSSEYALLTPQKKENIVQIIVNNFQDIFSWVDRV